MSRKFSFQFTLKLPLLLDNTLPAEVSEYVDEGFTLIAAWRLYLGLSQVQVATRARIPWQTYVNTEQRTIKASSQNLQKIADAMGIWTFQLIES